MLNRSASLAMSTSFLEALPGKFDITHLVFSIYQIGDAILLIVVVLREILGLN